MGNTYLGIDLGTSAMKIVLIDEKKNVLDQVTQDYQTMKTDAGRSEIDPEIWVTCMKNGIDKILADQDRSKLKRIGITGQMHTLIILDVNGKSIGPALMWNDLRAKELLPELRDKMKNFPDGDYLARTVSTGSPAANLYWLRKNQQEKFQKIHRFLIGPDYLVFRLTGEYCTDYCGASTSCLYQLSSREWSEDMRKLLGLPKTAYPKVAGSMTIAGCITEDMAELLHLEKDVEVLVGTGDNPATAISTGCLGKGYPVISLGTSGVLMMPVKEPDRQAKGKLILFSLDGFSYSCLIQGVVQSNGSTFDWCAKEIMGFHDLSAVDKKMIPDQMMNSEVLFYPHLAGDKTIYADPDLRGAFIGLGIDTDKYTLLYAVIEGLCFSLRQLAEEMQLPVRCYKAIKVVGGGAKSSVWMQTLANVLNMKIEKMNGMIGPAFGIAFLAAQENKDDCSFQKITEGTVKVEACYEPEEAAVQICEKKYQKYLRIQTGIKYISEDTI
ncbi:MAG: FGGY family carbohydrate kinase [Eubacteriales bacterium]|nr:FGGY family carbohydrate kinase [Eubacteriales bacterium]